MLMGRTEGIFRRLSSDTHVWLPLQLTLVFQAKYSWQRLSSMLKSCLVLWACISAGIVEDEVQRKQMRLAECRLGVGKVSETLFGFGSKFWVEETQYSC